MHFDGWFDGWLALIDDMSDASDLKPVVILKAIRDHRDLAMVVFQ
jgi:hypothetical protein